MSARRVDKLILCLYFFCDFKFRGEDWSCRFCRSLHFLKVLNSCASKPRLHFFKRGISFLVPFPWSRSIQTLFFRCDSTSNSFDYIGIPDSSFSCSRVCYMSRIFHTCKKSILPFAAPTQFQKPMYCLDAHVCFAYEKKRGARSLSILKLLRKKRDKRLVKRWSIPSTFSRTMI